jgi:hypothetical protein
MKRYVLFIAFLLLCSAPSFGQGCSVCTKTAQGLDDKSARGLNGGIIYLAFLPLVIMGSVGFIWWKNHNQRQ